MDTPRSSTQASAATEPFESPGDDEPPPPPLPISEILTVDELAALLRLNRKTVYAAIKLGQIPGVRRIGGTLRILRDAVLIWLAEGQGSVSRASRGHR